jgi:probable F420-dependent oxidoreductase
MGVVAGATERVRIGTSVLVLPYRNPLVLANEVATLDRLSEGRIILGIGAGWMDEEFEALGIPREERGARTDEHLEALRALWADEQPATFGGRWTRFRDVHLATRPHTPGGPPVLAGGNTAPALRRAGAVVDGWMGFEVFPEDAPASVARIREAAEGAGRDPAALMLAVRRGLLPPFEVGDFLSGRRAIEGAPDEVAAELERYREAGVGLVVLDLAMIPSEMIRTMEWFAGDVAPLLG